MTTGGHAQAGPDRSQRPRIHSRYDALGRTNSRTTGSLTETYAYAGTSQAVRAIRDGTPANDRVSLVDQAGSRPSLTSGGTTHWTLFDHLGSLVSTPGFARETHRTRVGWSRRSC
jgi:hypothetical protein